MRKLICGVAALAAAGVIAGCGSGSVASTLDPVARAAAVTSQLGGAQMSFDMRATSPKAAGAFDITGNGFFNSRTGEGQLSMDLSGVPGMSQLPGSKTMTMLYTHSAVYINAPMLSALLPGAKPWLETPIGRAGATSPLSSATGGVDPTQMLSYLRGIGSDVQNLGPATVQGVSTTHYRATISLDRVADRLGGQRGAAIHLLEQRAGLSSMPVEVWVDAQHRVRQEQISFQLNSGQAAGTSVVMTIDLTSFGPTPAVTPPPPSETTDAATLLAGALATH